MASRAQSGWFEQLFGFAEDEYEATQRRFVFEGETLRSLVNGRSFAVGRFTTPSLAWLRERTTAVRPGRLRFAHVIIGDVLGLHALPEHEGAVFQVASQFNCLEFADPRAVPEDGVTDYASDPTQGPACSLAAAAATVVRNYFAPTGGIPGQRRDRQLDNLDGLAALLGAPGAYWDVVNGYTWSDAARLGRLDAAIAGADREALLGAVKVGLHADVGVTFADRFIEPTAPNRVTQVFCSALSCGYTDVPLDRWETLARLVLDAAYEATLRAALLQPRAPEAGPPIVWLTLLGGGAFGNRVEWIAAAIGRALARLDAFDLDVRIAHHRAIGPTIEAQVEAARTAAP